MDRLPPPVRRVLAQWLGEVLGLFGRHVESVLLFGGVALGEFAPRWSDIDVAAALGRAPDPTEVRRLGEIQSALHDRYVHGAEGGWASEQLVEGVFVLTPMLTSAEGRGPGCEVETDAVRYLEDVSLEPFDRLVIARHALVLLGGPCLVAPPTEEALRAQLRRDLDRLELKGNPTPVWQAGMLHWGARSLRYWRDGVITSKGQALEHEARRGGPLAQAFRFAATCRDDGPSACRSRADEVSAVFEGAKPLLIAALTPFAG